MSFFQDENQPGPNSRPCTRLTSHEQQSVNEDSEDEEQTYCKGESLQLVRTKKTGVYVDDFFTSMDLLDQMSVMQLGITGTVRQNHLVGVPLPSKTEANKQLKRGDFWSVYTMGSTVVLWQENQPVYMVSNIDMAEPVGTCQCYSKQLREYITLSLPNLNSRYNEAMGGVDLLDALIKNYSITTRIRKWYWSLYTWMLNVIMVEAVQGPPQREEHAHTT